MRGWSYLLLCLALGLVAHAGSVAEGQQKDEKQKKKGKADPKVVARIAELTKGDAESFIKKFDKNGDGKLSEDELPPISMPPFERADKDGDGKLDKSEVEDML